VTVDRLRRVCSAMVDDCTCTGQWLCDQLSATSPAADGGVSSGLLVLDCRSVDEYTTSHVAGSLPVVVPSIMLRRLRNGSVSVAAVLSSSTARAVFSDRCRTSHVVLYDATGESVGDFVRSPCDGGGDSVVQVLMKRLKTDGCRVRYLLGNLGYVTSLGSY